MDLRTENTLNMALMLTVCSSKLEAASKAPKRLSLLDGSG